MGGFISRKRPRGGGAAKMGTGFQLTPPPPPADAPRHQTPVPEAPPAGPATKRTILLVDDDPAVRRMVQALFGRERHTVDVARNPQHSLDLARSRPYDLVLLDAQAMTRDHLFVA